MTRKMSSFIAPYLPGPAGTNIFRLNCSHRRGGDFERVYPLIRKYAKESWEDVSLLLNQTILGTWDLDVDTDIRILHHSRFWKSLQMIVVSKLQTLLNLLSPLAAFRVGTTNSLTFWQIFVKEYWEHMGIHIIIVPQLYQSNDLQQLGWERIDGAQERAREKLHHCIRV